MATTEFHLYLHLRHADFTSVAAVTVADSGTFCDWTTVGLLLVAKNSAVPFRISPLPIITVAVATTAAVNDALVTVGGDGDDAVG